MLSRVAACYSTLQMSLVCRYTGLAVLDVLQRARPGMLAV